ncbi:hypothetical protein [Taibaiella helva]|uniref:hypothetical protein n=1 Tax=Taibaiella helva TaxID=2301235 RepID=UPI000E595AB0|nr:hypothetical protein [Taibaiella helva]
MQLLEQILPKKFFLIEVTDNNVSELCKALSDKVTAHNYRSVYNELLRFLNTHPQKQKVIQFYYSHLSRKFPQVDASFLLNDLNKKINSLKPPRLLAAAKQFNISKSVLCDFLVSKGFNVDSNKPTSRITNEMYEELKKAYHPKITDKPKEQHKAVAKPVTEPIYLNEVARKYGLLEMSIIRFLSSKGYRIKSRGKVTLSEEMLRLIKSELRSQTKSSDWNKYSNHKAYVQNINGITEINFEIQWKDLVFDDYQVRVRYGGNLSNPFIVKESRKSYKYIAKHIQNLGLEPLKVTIKKNNITKIQNIEKLNEVVRILKIKKEFIENYHSDKVTKVQSVLKHLESVPNVLLRKLAQSRSISESIEYLCELHDDNFKIIPAIEIISSGNNILEQDTFIFTFKSKSSIFLIWESTLKGRATYIFKCSEIDIEDKLQKIFDYISSISNAKRTRLRNSMNDQVNLNYLTPINHTQFESWKTKVDLVLGK